jgi:hypothetical protein
LGKNPLRLKWKVCVVIDNGWVERSTATTRLGAATPTRSRVWVEGVYCGLKVPHQIIGHLLVLSHTSSRGGDREGTLGLLVECPEVGSPVPNWLRRAAIVRADRGGGCCNVVGIASGDHPAVGCGRTVRATPPPLDVSVLAA